MRLVGGVEPQGPMSETAGNPQRREEGGLQEGLVLDAVPSLLPLDVEALTDLGLLGQIGSQLLVL